MVYVYDFLRMWCFYVEVMGVEEGEAPEYPLLAEEFGTAPDQFSKEVDFGWTKSNRSQQKTMVL